MIEFQKRQDCYDQAFDAFNQKYAQNKLTNTKILFGRTEHLINLKKIDEDYSKGKLLDNPDIEILHVLNWLFINQPDTKIRQEAHYAVNKHANTIIVEMFNQDSNLINALTLDAHLIVADLKPTSVTAKFVNFKDTLDMWLDQLKSDSEYGLLKEINNDRIDRWIVRISDLKMIKVADDFNDDVDLGLYFIDHPDSKLVALYQHVLDLV